MVFDPSIPEALRNALAAALEELAKDAEGGSAASLAESGRPETVPARGFGRDMSVPLLDLVRRSTVSPELASAAALGPGFTEIAAAAHLESLSWFDEGAVELLPPGSSEEKELEDLVRAYADALAKDPSVLRTGIGWNVVGHGGRPPDPEDDGMDMPLSALVSRAGRPHGRLGGLAVRDGAMERTTTKAFLDAFRDEDLQSLGLGAHPSAVSEILDLALAHETEVRRRRRGWAFPVSHLAEAGSLSLMMRRVPLQSVADAMELPDGVRRALMRNEEGLADLTLHDFEHDLNRTVVRLASTPGMKRRDLDALLEACSVVAERVRRFEALGRDEAPEGGGSKDGDVLSVLSPLRRQAVEEVYGLGRGGGMRPGVDLAPERSGPMARRALADLRDPAVRTPFERIVAENDALIAETVTAGRGWALHDEAVVRASRLPGLVRLAVDVVAMGIRGWFMARGEKKGRFWVLHGETGPDPRTGLPPKPVRRPSRHPTPEVPRKPPSEAGQVRDAPETQRRIDGEKEKRRKVHAERIAETKRRTAEKRVAAKVAKEAKTGRIRASPSRKPATVRPEPESARTLVPASVAATASDGMVLEDRDFPDDVLDYDFAHVADLAGMTKGARAALRRRLRKGLPTLAQYVENREGVVALLRDVPGFGIAKERVLLAAAAGLISGDIAPKTGRAVVPPPAPRMQPEVPRLPPVPFVTTWFPDAGPPEPISVVLPGTVLPVGEDGEAPVRARMSWTAGTPGGPPPSDDETPLLARVASLPARWRGTVEALYGLAGAPSASPREHARATGTTPAAVEDVLSVALLRLASDGSVGDARRLVRGRRPPVVDDVGGVERLARDVLRMRAVADRRVHVYTRPEPVYRY